MKSRYTKLCALMMSLILVVSLAACGTQSGGESSQAPSEGSEPTVEDDGDTETDTPSDGVWQPFDANGNSIRTGRDAVGENGVVASSNYYATQIGLEILENGGNAVDAAVATGFALGVAEPITSGLGGGGFMIIRSGATGEYTFIDFREIAPAAATPEMWELDEDGKVVGNQKVEGGKSAGVPGEVAGLLYALETYGSMERQDIIQPSIDLATDGYTVGVTLKNAIADNYDMMMKYEELGNYYLNGGLPYEVGETITNPDLAKTLGIIAEQGREGFYKGEVAEAFVEAVQKYDGLITLEDLENYEISIRDVVSSTYRGYEIISAAPPSSGGAHLIQILNILENFEIGEMEVNSAEYIHVFSEAFKMAFADRSAYMADTDFQKVPLDGLTSKEYAAELAGKIDMAQSGTYGADDPYKYESGSTTHYSVADKDGNIVAVTKTINNFWGSGVAVAGYGFIANNEMDDFETGTESVNRVEPGKKPLSSMTPTIILKDGQPFATLGSPGATRIFPTLVQVISHIIDHDMDIQTAIDTPRFYDNAANSVNYESSIDPAVIEALIEMGHEVNERGEWDLWFGGVQGIIYQDDGTIHGGADPRRDGKALAY